MTQITLAPGMTLDLHPPTGYDDLVSLSIRVKMEPFLPEFQVITGTFLFQDRFALLLACTDSSTGLPFDLPSPDAEGAALGAAYRAWLKLPRRVFRKWFDALEAVEAQLNAPDLLPGVESTDPLASSAEPTKSST